MNADDAKWIDENLTEYKKYLITLSVEDQEMVRHVAGERTKDAKKNKYHKNWGKVSPHDIDLEGCGAEVAFCRIFGFEFDSVRATKLIKDSYDCISTKGNKVDVKWTNNLDNGLMVKATKKKGAVDIYALMIGKFPSYEFIGYSSEDDLFQEKNIRPSPFGHTNYVLLPDQLKKIT